PAARLPASGRYPGSDRIERRGCPRGSAARVHDERPSSLQWIFARLIQRAHGLAIAGHHGSARGGGSAWLARARCPAYPPEAPRPAIHERRTGAVSGPAIVAAPRLTRALVGQNMGTMTAVMLDNPGQPLRLVERPMPDPGPEELLLRVLACGVCRTDLH